MTRHSSRPVPAKRLFASLSEPHYPVRESDGEPHVGTMLDLRQLRIDQARYTAIAYLKRARSLRSQPDMWNNCMLCAALHRSLFAGLKRSGGRVDWRGEPVQENV